MAELEDAQHFLTGQLQKPEGTVDFAAISRRLGEIQHEIAASLARWEEASRQLEEFDAQFAPLEGGDSVR
jgi:hypothetical protein